MYKNFPEREIIELNRYLCVAQEGTLAMLLLPQKQRQPFPPLANLVIAEYNALRAEILKLTEIQFQIIVVTLASFGTVLTVGTQVKNAPILLAYPLLALFLVMVWINHAYGIDFLGTYIQNKIECQVGTENIGWESYSRRKPTTHSLLAFWASRAIFVLLQLIALVAGWIIMEVNVLTISLVVLSSISIAISAFVFIRAGITQARGKRLGS